MDRLTSPSPGYPAPYGHACANCAQSKCKCIVRRTGERCERCHRLNKECRPAETVRRRNPRRSAVSKTTRLEEKLDGIVSLLQARGPSGAVVVPPLVTTTQTNANTYHQSRKSLVSSKPNNYIHNAPILTPARTESMDSPYEIPYSGYAGEPSLVEAEEYLISFQAYKLRYFPFVDIPSTITAQQLRQERPFLWLCIMAISSRSTSQQQVLGDKIRQTIAEEMVLRSEKNIDLLLGLLTFIGWANYQVHPKPFLSVFTQLAVSLVFDLNLNKPIPKDSPAIPCGKQRHLNHCTLRTMEDARAVLGCFLVTSIISFFLQRIDALCWTSHMNECLQLLDEKKECSNDEILVHQVRLQLIVENLHGRAMESAQHGSLLLENLHSQLQDIKTSCLSESQRNEVLLLHIYSIELETSLSPTFLNSLRTNQLTSQQQKLLNAGLESIKSWFDILFTIPPAAYIGFPFSIFLQLVRCLMILYRVMNLDDPAWSENCIWKANPLLILDRVIDNMKQVTVLAGLDNSDSPEGDVFSRSSRTLQSLRSEWESKLGTHDMLFSALPTQNINDSDAPGNFEEDFFNNDWFMDMLSPNF